MKIQAVLRAGRALVTAKPAPVILLAALALSPFLYRALPQAGPIQITKIALVVAFSGQLQARGNDISAATQLAIQHANADGSHHGLAEVSALDDHGQPQTAIDQAQGVAADPNTRAVLCCGTAGALKGIMSLLPTREPLLPLLATSSALPTAEAALALRQFGTGTAVVLSDQTTPGDSRSATLTPALGSAGYAVKVVPIDFAGGSNLGRVAAAVAAERPSVVVLDTDYPAAAALGQALRAGGVTAPLLGDDRLDGAQAAELLSALGPVWYVAPDRNALLRQAPSGFPMAFAAVRGHPPAARDVLAYVQARAAVGDGGAPIDPGQLPLALYAVIAGQYPGQPAATAPGRTP